MMSHTQASRSIEVKRVVPGEWENHVDLAEKFAKRMVSFDAQWDDIASNNAKDLLAGTMYGNSVFYFFGDWCLYFTDVIHHAFASMHFLAMRDDAEFTKDVVNVTKRVIRDMFADYTLIRIAAVAPDWLKTDRVAEMVGMVREGTLRASMLYKGVWRDAHMFSVIKSDLDNE